MDFKVAPAILDSLQAILTHGVLGYTATDDEYFQAIIDWNKKQKKCSS